MASIFSYHQTHCVYGGSPTFFFLTNGHSGVSMGEVDNITSTAFTSKIISCCSNVPRTNVHLARHESAAQ